jgi:hypothetical protein
MKFAAALRKRSDVAPSRPEVGWPIWSASRTSPQRPRPLGFPEEDDSRVIAAARGLKREGLADRVLISKPDCQRG